MTDVIKNGTLKNYETICRECKCEFSFTGWDVDYNYNGMHVCCPCCGHCLFLDTNNFKNQHTVVRNNEIG